MNGPITHYALDINTGLPDVLSDGSHTYTYGLGNVSQSSGTATDYFLGDALGSTRQLTDVTGQVGLAVSYDPFGNLVASSGSNASIFGYAGQQTDPSGLQFLRARYYQPYLNQFIQPDSIVPDPYQPADWNHYLYARDNPINFTDPSGLSPSSGTSVPDRRDLIDWLPHAAVYMATDPAIQEIKRLNSSPNMDQQILAYDKFYNLVHSGARFDVKIKIQERLGRSIKLGDNWYEYSITGNFLYGFYGSAAGYGPDVLHAGAGFAQMMDLLHWLWIAGSQCDFPHIGGPQHYFDTPDDAFAIDFGIWSYKTYFVSTGTFTEPNLRQGLESYENAWGLHRVLDPGDYIPNTGGPYAPDYFDQ